MKLKSKIAPESDLTAFYDSLKVDIQLMSNPEDVKELQEMMRVSGYRQTKEEKLYPTDKQIRLAQEFINARQPQKEIFERYTDYAEERYDKIEVIRAYRDIMYKGKRYRKGQFLPKGVRY